MLYLDPFFYVSVLVAGILCGIVRGTLIRQMNETGDIGQSGLCRKFLSSYESVPVVSALIGLSVFLVMITVDNLATQRGDDLEGISYFYAALVAAGIPFFLGIIIGIPIAALTCFLLARARSALT